MTRRADKLFHAGGNGNIGSLIFLSQAMSVFSRCHGPLLAFTVDAETTKLLP